MPIAPALATSTPSLASVTAVPPAEPAGVIAICSTSAPPWPAGMLSHRADEHVDDVDAERDDLHRARLLRRLCSEP